MGSIFINGKTINYIIETKNVKNINFRLNADGIVKISANKYVSESIIRELILKNSSFIEKCIFKNENKKHIGIDNIEFITGAEIFFLGEKVTVKFENGYEKSHLDDYKILHIYENFQDNDIAQKIAVEKFLSEQLQQILNIYLEQTLAKLSEFSISMPIIKIRKMKSRWGSCNKEKNIITFNSKLIFLPTEFIEYVVVHEFCHLLVFNHSKAFYSCVERILPNYKKAKEISKEYTD